MAEDKNLTCRDCGKTFVFTAGEQAFFEEKGLSAPIRCPDCRRLRKQQRNDTVAPAGGPDTRTAGPRREGEARSPGGDRPASGPPRTNDFAPRVPRAFPNEPEEDTRKAARKPGAKGPAARFTPPKRETAPVPKEKRPNNRRGEDELLRNWKEEVGLEDGENDDWLAAGDEEEES